MAWCGSRWRSGGRALSAGRCAASLDRELGSTKRLRVLHLATVPFRAEEGVSRAMTALAEHLPAETEGAVESHLAADRPDGDAFAGHHLLTHWQPGRLLTGRALHRLMAEADPQLVHLHGGILAPSLALSRALQRLPVVATVYQLLPVPRHELGFHQLGDARRSSLRPARIAASAVAGLPLARRLLALGGIEAVCTPDPRVGEALRRYGPVLMARGGASPSPLTAVWADPPTIGFAGRAEPGRGVEELIAAVALLRQEIPGIRLRLLLLPGPAAERWRESHGHDPRIELSIGVRRLDAELARCQVVALPFRIPATITPPLVAAEAMSMGVPVVATPLSCITPLIRSGVNGVLARDMSPAALADALRSALADRATWTRLSDGARRTIADDWSWAGAAAVTGEAYAIALARHRVRTERSGSHRVSTVPSPFTLRDARS